MRTERMRLAGKVVSTGLIALGCLVASRAPAQTYNWLPPTNKVTLMAVWAHPDDEGIFGGGSLTYYSTVLNLPTMLVCMTAGLDGMPRTQELCCASWTYGLRYKPVMGPFTDINSGAATNNPYTNTIDMTWDYWAGIGFQGDGSDVQAGKTRAINYVAEQIRRYRPDVVITHDVNGESGHDNHKATAYAVMKAFFVAADPTATATNLVGLPPWQVQKLYVHLYPTNRLFHEFWETPYAALSSQTPHQVVNEGLPCNVSQGPTRWICASVYPPASAYDSWPSEWWGLYASMVGPDTVRANNIVVNGYNVPSGVSAGNFLEHIQLGALNPPPAFASNPVMLPPMAAYDTYSGQPLTSYVIAAQPTTLTFGKRSGPAWLNVAADGTLSGSPSRTDAGTNSWIVSVTNQTGLVTQTTLTMTVLGRAVGMENLVGWWRLNETNPASPAATNSAPLSPDGVSYGGTVFGQPGARPWTQASVQLDGTDGKIDVPYTALLNPPVFTVSLWANAMGGRGTYRSPLTSRMSAPQAGYVFYASVNDRWQFWTGNGSAWTALTGTPVVTNTWIHLAATYDGTNVCFYTNGVLAATAKVGFLPNSAFPLRIGAGATEGSGGYWFPGCVDDVRVYRVALDAAHVWTIYTAPPLVSTIVRQSNGTMLLGGSALPNQTYVLLASSSRIGGADWMPIATNTTGQDGSISFVDADADGFSQRYYRLTLP